MLHVACATVPARGVRSSPCCTPHAARRTPDGCVATAMVAQHGWQAARVAAKGKLERENHDVRLAMMRAEQQEQRVTRCVAACSVRRAA